MNVAMTATYTIIKYLKLYDNVFNNNVIIYSTCTLNKSNSIDVITVFTMDRHWTKTNYTHYMYYDMANRVSNCIMFYAN